MDAQALCNVCTPFHRKPTLLRSPSASSNSLNFRRKMTVTSELQTTTPTPSVNGAYSQSVRTHKVTVNDRQRGLVHEFVVPEDQYILHTAEDQDISLPFACRHGCCTSCAVRIKSGEIRQPEALGISAELKAKKYKDEKESYSRTLHKDKKAFKYIQLLKNEFIPPFLVSTDNFGYALLCVGFPTSDIEVETQDEDEVYWLQFGRYFARGPIERDDYALELAMGDE